MFKWFVVGFIAVVLVIVGVWSAVGYVAVHFIGKFW